MSAPPLALLARLTAVAIGLALVFGVEGAAAVAGWTLIAWAVISEIVGSVVYLRRRR